MNALSQYLVNARPHLGDGDSAVTKVRELYKKDPGLFEYSWKQLFVDEGSYLAAKFAELLEEKGLYVQYEKYCPRFRPETRSMSLELRVYPYDMEVGDVACLKVTEFEQTGANRVSSR